jgi:signal transduction histidine kinase
MIWFFTTRGVVTFNDRVFGNDCMFIQQDTAAMFVSLKGRKFAHDFQVGQWLELGGPFQPGKNIPTINPLAITELGRCPLPAPSLQVVQFPVPGNRDGRWTEVRGVVHAVNSNGTVVLEASGGPLSAWIGKTSREDLTRYIDAEARLRGVLTLTLQDAPLLLVPSPSFVEMEQAAPQDSFSVPIRLASNIFENAEASVPHRIRLTGHVTFVGIGLFFMQDTSGGVCVQPVEEQTLQIGQAVEVVGFPLANGPTRTLTEALVRPREGSRVLRPQKLNAGKAISFNQSGALVQLNASLIARRFRGGSQIFELQEKQRVFEAELPIGRLPAFAPGSRLQLSGVCDFVTVTPAASEAVAVESPSSGALKLWLRSPADVVLLSRPPWWTWRRAAMLFGTLLTVLALSLLRIHLLRRRLERHLAFSRQILESQESERHRIAANLHDSLGQNLLLIKNQARLAMQQATDESILHRRLGEISGCASQAIDEVREITHALRPYQLDRLGLTQAIRAVVNRAAENTSILFASHADDIDGLFDKESEIQLYRIVQEAVNNILKHSAASEAVVVVKKLEATISLSIRDNGRGFDAGAPRPFDSQDVGHGVTGIKERVRILGGMFAIDSRPGQGTSLNIEIPIPVSKHETRSETINRG